MSKRKIKILFSLFVFFASLLTVFVSGGAPKSLSPFSPVPPTSAPDQVWAKRDAETILEAEELIPSGNSSDQSSVDSLPVSDDTSYKVVKVVDGDTIDVEIDGKIERLRLIGIDTPETVDPRKSVQCFGIQASNKAKETLLDKFVTLESDSSQGERDKYGRLLRYAHLLDGTNFGLLMISQGFAHEYTYHYPYKYQAQFKQAEIDARENNKGLWSPDTCSGNK